MFWFIGEMTLISLKQLLRRFSFFCRRDCATIRRYGSSLTIAASQHQNNRRAARGVIGKFAGEGFLQARPFGGNHRLPVPAALLGRHQLPAIRGLQHRERDA